MVIVMRAARDGYYGLSCATVLVAVFHSCWLATVRVTAPPAD